MKCTNCIKYKGFFHNNKSAASFIMYAMQDMQRFKEKSINSLCCDLY